MKNFTLMTRCNFFLQFLAGRIRGMGESYVFIHVCHSVHMREVVCPAEMSGGCQGVSRGCPGRRWCVLVDVSTGAVCPVGVLYHPTAPRYCQPAVGTHPTGMHSCSVS